MADILVNEPRRPGYTSTLEFISISGEHIFPAKKDVLNLQPKAIGLVNAAAAFFRNYAPEKIPQVVPAGAGPELGKKLVAAGFPEVATLLPAAPKPR